MQEGEFAGVELTFMGLNNQNQHNFLFRGFLKPWETYTGAKINWIDLAQADYNARLQQSIATGTVDFDVIEMGAPFEGDVCGKGLASEMPDWVRRADRHGRLRQLPEGAGRHLGRQDLPHLDRRRLPHLRLPHRRLLRPEPRRGLEGRRQRRPSGACPPPGRRCRRRSKFLTGKTDPTFGTPLNGFLDPLKGWGGFGFYFLEDRATAYAKHPDDPAWLFDPDTMKPRVNNPAFVRAIQDVLDIMDTQPADQINADPGTTAFQQFLAGTGSMLTWWGDVGSNARTSDTSVVGDVVGFSILPGADEVYNTQTGAWETPASGPNFAPNMAYIGWGVYVMARVDGDEKKKKAAWSAAAHLGGKDLSLWMAAYPSGFQPYRNSHFNYDEWEAAGYDRAYHRGLPRLEPRQLQPPERRDRAAHPRHLPVLLDRRGRARQDLRRPVRLGPGGRRRHRRRLGEDHRPDRPRQPDRPLQGEPRHRLNRLPRCHRRPARRLCASPFAEAGAATD